MGMAAIQKMQQQMLKIQEDLGKETVEATAGGGAVKATMTGQQKLVSVIIDPEVVDQRTLRCCRTRSWPPWGTR